MRILRLLQLAATSLAMALVVYAEPGPVTSAETPVQAHSPAPVAFPDSIKQPVRWLDWGFDFRFRNEYVLNAITLDNSVPDNESDYLRLRPRLWTTFKPVTDVTLNFRLISEPRYYFRPQSQEGWTGTEGLFDLFNVRYTNAFRQPLVLTVGRQEFQFGNKWLIWDGTLMDGSRTEFFDAIRATFEVKQFSTTFDVIYLHQDYESDAWLPVINDQDRGLVEQTENGTILYARNKSIQDLIIDGYLIYRDEDEVIPRGNEGHLWTAGGRVEGKIGSEWDYRAEAAPQWGHINGADTLAWGFNSLVTRNLGGTWNHKVRMGYEYLSGDDPDTATNESWDSLWARRAQWSELMVMVFSTESNGRPGDYKNLQRIDFGWSAKPTKILDLSFDYMPLFANQNPLGDDPGFSEDGKFRGHFMQGIARFTFGRYWSGHLWGELFFPGDYYGPERRDMAVFFRTEIMFKF